MLQVSPLQIVNVRIVPMQERQQKRYRDKSLRRDSNTENIDAPNPLNSSVTNETKQHHFFHNVYFFSLQKSITCYHYFNLSYTMLVSVTIFDMLEFVK